jgi:hypothetical protein
MQKLASSKQNQVSYFFPVLFSSFRKKIEGDIIIGFTDGLWDAVTAEKKDPFSTVVAELSIYLDTCDPSIICKKFFRYGLKLVSESKKAERDDVSIFVAII